MGEPIIMKKGNTNEGKQCFANDGLLQRQKCSEMRLAQFKTFTVIYFYLCTHCLLHLTD
jgi:hypothetical protein